MPPSPILQRMLEMVPDMCFVLRGDQTVLGCNKRAQDATGLPAVPEEARSFLSILCSRFTATGPSILHRTVSTGKQRSAYKAPTVAPLTRSVL